MATDLKNTCMCRVCYSVRETIRDIFCVLEKYKWLMDAYILDFYEEDLWSRLPSSWKSFFQDTTAMELGTWILNEHSRTRVWPMSLLALRRVIKLLQINRDQTGEIWLLKCENIGKESMQLTNSSGLPSYDEQEATKNASMCSSHPKLRNVFSKNVKPKKKHEIDIMAKIIADCAASAKCECVLDVGAGMGHLARTLAYNHNMCVTCVEQQSLLSERARDLDTRLDSMAFKYLLDVRGQKPNHVSLIIERGCSGSLVIDRLNEEFKEKFVLNPELSGFGLIGLHPCGDLATTLLEFYAESEAAKFICIAGCCYMKLTLGDDVQGRQSYPISQYLRHSNTNKLSYTALEVACHAVESHCDKLKSAEYWNLKVHAYRAALESLLVKKDSTLRHGSLKSVKLKKNTSFQEYCIAATENLCAEVRPGILGEIENPQVLEFLDQWERVVIFGSLRLMLAPLVESVVLLDRFLFLSEKKLSPRLKAVFDPLISPRNFVLTSVK